MIFLFIAPFALGPANYLIPLQIGAPDMAFPRLNATLVLALPLRRPAIFAGAVDERRRGRGGLDRVRAALGDHDFDGTGSRFLDHRPRACIGIASILTAINFVTTTFIFRAPGMTMWRLPIFTWEMIATSLLIFMAFPSLTATLLLLFVDRRSRRPLFRPGLRRERDSLPASVLVLRSPGSLRPDPAVLRGGERGHLDVLAEAVFGYTGLVLAAFAIAGLSMGVWAHHMFTTGAVATRSSASSRF